MYSMHGTQAFLRFTLIEMRTPQADASGLTSNADASGLPAQHQKPLHHHRGSSLLSSGTLLLQTSCPSSGNKYLLQFQTLSFQELQRGFPCQCYRSYRLFSSMHAITTIKLSHIAHLMFRLHSQQPFPTYKKGAFIANTFALYCPQLLM